MCEELPCHIPTLHHHVIHFQRVPIMLCCEWCSLSPSIPDHIFTAQTPSSGEEYPEVLHYTSLYLIIPHYTCDDGLWTADIPIQKGDYLNIWTVISERLETNARGAIWLRPTKDHSLLKINKQINK